MSRTSPGRQLAIVGAVVVAFVVVCFGVCFGFPCFPTGIRHGLWLDRCPTGDLRLAAQVDTHGWVRGQEGRVRIQPLAVFLDGDGAWANARRRGFARGIAMDLVLVDAAGESVDGFKVKTVRRAGGGLWATVHVPVIPDGDYVLRAALDAGFEARTVEVPIPLYAPALVHLATDRPLYKPGQEVLLRSVTWRRTDLSPLDGRPGTWVIRAPDGAVVHEERDAAGPWGIADTSFPLDRLAQVGTWTARWSSGEASDEVTFDVRPFKLPRFTVEARAGASWFRMSDRVWLEGRAIYASGAPVADAPVTVRLRRAEGRWPMPLAWEEPLTTRTDRRGRWSIEVGMVPADLVDRAVVAAAVEVIESGGEVARAGARIVLSADPVAVEAVTAFDDGLVEGFNNRVYLRVTTPDGKPLRHADVAVRPAWDPNAAAQAATTDADGVAALQIDPGAPVTVVIPPAPVRVRPLVPASPSVAEATELTTPRSLDLPERRTLDALYPGIAACGTYAIGAQDVTVGFEVDRAGRVTDLLVGERRVDGCVADVMRRAAFPAGETRLYRLRWRVPDSLQPKLTASWDVAVGAHQPVQSAVDEALLDARDCLPRGTGRDGATLVGRWRTVDDDRRVRAEWSRLPGRGLSPAQLGCIEAALAGLVLDEDPGDAMGVVRLSLSVPRPPGAHRPEAQTVTGYELEVAVTVDAEDRGSTRLRMSPGQVPPMRLRATPSLAAPGDDVRIELLRGPDWHGGDLPEELVLYEGTVKVDEADVEDGAVTFTVPDDVDGFLHATFAGARAVVFVQRPDPLTVDVHTAKGAYRPGDQATLAVTTRAGEGPVSAAVGLMGVDATLGQLAPLLGPDDPGRVIVRAETGDAAFGTFDAKSLVLGTIRGENAAKAAVMRITQLPMDPAGDAPLSVGEGVEPDATLELTSAFYRTHGSLRAAVRAWEESAPDGELMEPPRMARMWTDALAAQRKAGTPATDAFGRELTLAVLPDELLVQLDPRQVVGDATRLPEDVIDWTRWVRQEVN